jgi:hypothetical protein
MIRPLSLQVDRGTTYARCQSNTEIDQLYLSKKTREPIGGLRFHPVQVALKAPKIEVLLGFRPGML